MSSPTPPPEPSDSLIPPTRSHAPALIAVAMGMAVVGGGLLWWKLGGASPAHASAALPPAASSPAERLTAAPPPPPPPPAASEEPSKSQPEEKRAQLPAQVSPCSASCKGSVTNQLVSALRSKAGAARSCYERALRQNEMLQGRMTIGVRVGTNGSVCGANVVSDSLGDPSVASCVTRMIRAGALPAPTGGCVDVQVPLSFVGKT